MIASKKIQQNQREGLAVQVSKIQQSFLQSSQSGFTLIESLMAVVMVSVLMTALSPVIVLSVATRVQARRVELATQAARAYIDGVRTGTIAAPSNTITLNEVSKNTFVSQRSVFAQASVPTSTGSSPCPTTAGNQYCQNSSATTPSLYCIDIDGNGCGSTSYKNLVVQAFRSVNPTSTDQNQGYILGVRVYRLDAFSDSSSLKNTYMTNNQQATFMGSLGDRKAPLLEMTTEIAMSQTNYGYFCSRFGGC